MYVCMTQAFHIHFQDISTVDTHSSWCRAFLKGAVGPHAPRGRSEYPPAVPCTDQNCGARET